MSTPAKDLRTFLAQVKERFPDELVHVHRDVDLKFEVSAVLVKLDRAHKFPIVIFDNLATAAGGRSAFPLRHPYLDVAIRRGRAGEEIRHAPNRELKAAGFRP